MDPIGSRTGGLIAALAAGISNTAEDIKKHLFTASHDHKRFVRNHQSRKSAPGAKRKGIKYMRPIPKNVARRATKPMIAGFPHQSMDIGRAPAPSLDRVRNLERAYQVKLHVIAGKLYHRNTTRPFDLKEAEKEFWKRHSIEAYGSELKVPYTNI